MNLKRSLEGLSQMKARDLFKYEGQRGVVMELFLFSIRTLRPAWRIRFEIHRIPKNIRIPIKNRIRNEGKYYQVRKFNPHCSQGCGSGLRFTGSDPRKENEISGSRIKTGSEMKESIIRTESSIRTAARMADPDPTHEPEYRDPE